MKIILREDVEKLERRARSSRSRMGRRNYLIPRQLAVLANVREHEGPRSRPSHDRDAGEEDPEDRRGDGATLSAISLTLPAKAGEEGKLFGAITFAGHRGGARKAGVAVDRKAIQLADPIKQWRLQGEDPGGGRRPPEISVSVVPNLDRITNPLRTGGVDGRKSRHDAGATSLLRVPPTTSTRSRRPRVGPAEQRPDQRRDGVLRPGDFYQGAHRILYEAMVDLYDAGAHRPAHPVRGPEGPERRTAGRRLAYLSEIVTSVPISDNVVHYARIVKEKSISRKTISAAQEISAAAFQGVADIDVFLDRTEQAIFAIAEEKIRPSYYAMGEMAREAMKESRRRTSEGADHRRASGFRDLDQSPRGSSGPT